MNKNDQTLSQTMINLVNMDETYFKQLILYIIIISDQSFKKFNLKIIQSFAQNHRYIYIYFNCHQTLLRHIQV